MKIGIVLQTSPQSGGAFGYENIFREHLLDAAKSLGIELVTFSPAQVKGQDTVRYQNTAFRMLLAHLRANVFLHKIFGLLGLQRSHLERLATKNDIDLLVFASPNHQAPGIHGIPFASTVWDFGHRDRPQGSEVSLGGIWSWRESLYSTTLGRSLLIFCDSLATSEKLTKQFGVLQDRIFRVGLLPNVPHVAKPSDAEQPYLIYPAMFWPHKNHLTIIRALRILRDQERVIPRVVFTGVGATQGQVRALVKNLGLDKFVDFRGLVSREELAVLIARSAGLLMPSLIGPSNLPPLEAALLGVPSVVSDVHEMNDLIVGVPAIPALDPFAWANSMECLISGEVSVGELQDLGSKDLIRSALAYAKLWLEPWDPKAYTSMDESTR
jgi:glycosyltransferase involved in cell wall biosynthesis